MPKYIFPLFVLIFISSAITAQVLPQGIPAGYYDAATGKTCEGLKTALFQIISSSHRPVINDSLIFQFRKTDIKRREVSSGSDSVIWDVYSDNPVGKDPYNFDPINDKCGNYNSEGDCFNKEHTVPVSWFSNSLIPEGDYQHIYPTDGYVNGKRANYVFGEVANPVYQSLNGGRLGPSAVAGISGTVYEPLDSFKGDMARAFFYFVTRYQSQIPGWSNNTDAFANSTYPSIDIFYLQQMLAWNQLDPVSQKEIDRNEGGFSYQKNRNPFVDHPEYVQQTWNGTCPGLGTLPVDIAYFGGKLIDNAIVLTWITGNEINLDHFVIEKSFNGIYYTGINEITPEADGHYSYSDPINSDRGRRVYYRLKKVDIDNSFSYSAVFSLQIPSFKTFSCYPNPARNIVTFKLENTVTAPVLVQFIDMAGKLVLSQKGTLNNGIISIPVNTIVNGIYYCKLLVNGQQYMQKIIVQH